MSSIVRRASLNDFRVIVEGSGSGTVTGLGNLTNSSDPTWTARPWDPYAGATVLISLITDIGTLYALDTVPVPAFVSSRFVSFFRDAFFLCEMGVIGRFCPVQRRMSARFYERSMAFKRSEVKEGSPTISWE